MSVTDISFPGLGIYLKNVPKSFTVFGFEIAMYGIVIGLAVLLGFAICLKLAKKEQQNPDLYWDLAIYAVVFSIIGARLYYVIFSWDYYKDNLLSIFNIRGGGLAIYGAVIAGFLTCLIFCKIKKLSFFQIIDVCVNGLILGQIIGRWANFFNRECFGDYCSNFIRMILPVNAVRSGEITSNLLEHAETIDGISCISVHPTFLYESVWNLIILACMLLYRKHKKFNGEIALIYLGGYGLGRFIVEGMRTDQLKWFGSNVAVSQVLGILMFAGALVADIIIRVLIAKGKIKQDKDIQTETEEKEESV